MPVSIPGIENLSPAVKYVIAFAIIFVLLALFALILRRLTGGRMTLSSDRGRARQPRLGIVDVYDLDRQRQLILLRRDNVEHLLLVGGPNDVVVETNIVRVPGARLPVPPPAEAAERSEPGADRHVEIAPMRPVVEPSLSRFPDRGQDTIGARLEPTEALASIVGPAGVEAALKPTRVLAGPSAPPPAPPPRSSAPRPNPQPPAREGNGADRAAPPDMTRELEAALRRPPPGAAETGRSAASAAAARPSEPVPAAAPPPARARSPEPPPRPAPAAPAAPPQPVKRAAPPPPPAAPAAPPAGTAPSAGASAAGTGSAPSPAPSPAPQPAPAPPPAPPPAAKPETPPPPAAAKPDPFSIEDIEAEFARLLGRPLDKKE